jgi:hypothetical protein
MESPTISCRSSSARVDGQFLVANRLGQTATVSSSYTAPASGYDGTSRAAPHVSAVAALVWGAAFTRNTEPTRFLARTGFPMRALTVLQTVKADSLLKFLTTVILVNKMLAYNIVHAWMAERNCYFISAEQWSCLNEEC